MLLDILILAGFGFFLYHAVILLKNLILFLIQPFLCGLAGACIGAFPAWCIEYSILNTTPYTLVAAGAIAGFVIGFVIGLFRERSRDNS